MNSKKLIKYFTNLLKDDEILLLKSQDSFYKNHYLGSPLNKLTNFSGTEGEAVIDKSGKITIFVDTRYHILADKQVFEDVEVYKMSLGETFLEAFEKQYSKNTVLFVPNDILLKDYLKLDKHFDLRKYTLDKKYLKNLDINKKEKIFEVDNEIEKLDFTFKVEKLKKTNKGVNKMLVFDLDEIAYLTNLRSFQMNFSSLFASILYLDFKNSNYILFLDDDLKNIKINNLKIMKLECFNDFISSVDEEIYYDIDKITLENFLLIQKFALNHIPINLLLIAF